LGSSALEVRPDVWVSGSPRLVSDASFRFDPAGIFGSGPIWQSTEARPGIAGRGATWRVRAGRWSGRGHAFPAESRLAFLVESRLALVVVNRIHRRLCASPEWAKTVAIRLPQVLDRDDLGDDLLEIGPGYGATTAVLAQRYGRLTALEVDTDRAAALAGEFDGRARIVPGSGAAMPFADGEFSGVVCFTMLHHVPSAALQDDLFAEAHRVLAAGGVFAGSDSQLSLRFRLLHIGDTMVVVDAGTLAARLGKAGFTDIRVEHDPKRTVRFWARKAGSAQARAGA
jgi:SAM-dependent methyltransferase